MNRAEYDAYLRSDAWAAVRERALKRAVRRCQLCNHGGNLQVHPRTYDRVGRERTSDLVVLCEWCHARCRYRLIYDSRYTDAVRALGSERSSELTPADPGHGGKPNPEGRGSEHA